MKKFNRISFLKGFIIFIGLVCFIYFFYFSKFGIYSSKGSIIFIIFASLFAGVYNLPIIYKKRKK